MTLDQVQANREVTIVKIGGEKAVRRRLMDLGLLPKTTILVTKTAPLGDPMEIKVRNTDLTIRKKDAQNITVI